MRKPNLSHDKPNKKAGMLTVCVRTVAVLRGHHQGELARRDWHAMILLVSKQEECFMSVIFGIPARSARFLFLPTMQIASL